LKAVVLVSGGIDSLVCLALAKEQGYECIALSFNYGQRHLVELRSAKILADHYRCEHRIVHIACAEAFQSSSLVGKHTIPAATAKENCGENIPSTYVPGRNTLFLSYAASIAEGEECSAIFFGPNAADHSGYPDCRPAFVEAFQQVLNLSSKQAVEGNPPQLITPLLHMDKADIIHEGKRLGVPFTHTHTCYEPDAEGNACQKCLSCVIRREAFAEVGIKDPAERKCRQDQ
jgi:7-cyano-7-deazaguanine synthase